MLEVKNLSVSFPDYPGRDKRVLNGIGLSLKAGNILGIVGESGAGKSVFARTLLGLIPTPGRMTSGEIYFKNILITAPRHKRAWEKLRGREISIVLQEPMSALNPVLSIADQLCEVAMHHNGMSRRQSEEAARHVLETLKVRAPGESLGKYPHELSGGERQRAAVAAALLAKPSLLILDEPTTALDIFNQHDLLRYLVSRQKKEGFAIIFITHDVALAIRYATDIAVMCRGEIVECLPAVNFLNKARKPYTRRLLSALPERGTGKGPIQIAELTHEHFGR